MMYDSRQNRRRFLKTAGVVGTVGLAGCSGNSDDGGTDSSGGTDGSGESGSDTDSGTTNAGGSGSTSEVVWLHDRANAEETIDEMVSEFNDQNSGITVEARLTPSGTGTDEELQKMRAAGNPPEILWFTFGQAYRFAQEGNLAAITGIVEDNGLRTFTDREDKFFATSIVGPVTWHYRQDIFDEPETYADYLRQARRIDEERDITPLQFPNGETTLAESMIQQLLWNGDVTVWEGSGEDIDLAMATGQERQDAIETFEWIQSAYEHASNGNGLGWGDAAGAYAEGSAASVPFISMWIPTLYLAETPDIRENTYNGFHPAATDAENDRKFSWFEGNMVWDTENKDAAREFLDWFHAEEQQRRFISTNAGDYIPPTEDGMNADWYRSNDAVHQEMMDLFASEAENFTPPVATGTDGALNYTAVSSGLLFGQAAAQLLHGGKSPGETIDWVQSQLDG